MRAEDVRTGQRVRIVGGFSAPAEGERHGTVESVSRGLVFLRELDFLPSGGGDTCATAAECLECRDDLHTIPPSLPAGTERYLYGVCPHTGPGPCEHNIHWSGPGVYRLGTDGIWSPPGTAPRAVSAAT